jgi:hypothetical protein
MRCTVALWRGTNAYIYSAKVYIESFFFQLRIRCFSSLLPGFDSTFRHLASRYYDDQLEIPNLILMSSKLLMQKGTGAPYQSTQKLLDCLDKAAAESFSAT